MSKKDLVDLMEELTKQLKGAPLKEFERKQMAAVFENAEGSVFDRARTAVREVLHAAPGFIDERAEALSDVSHLLDDLKSRAASYSE